MNKIWALTSKRMGISSSNILTEPILLNNHNYRFWIYDSRGFCCSAFFEASEAIIVLRLLEIPRMALKTDRAALEHQSLEDFSSKGFMVPGVQAFLLHSENCPETWGNSLIGNVLALQTGGPKFIPRAHIKRGVVLNPNAERAETGESLGLSASLALVSPEQWETLLKEGKGRKWWRCLRKKHQRLYPWTSTHTYTHTGTHTRTHTHVIGNI